MDLDLAISLVSPTGAYRLSTDKQSVVEWRGPGAQPTQQQLQAAWDAHVAAEVQKAADTTTTRNAVLSAAGSAVGINITALTAIQVRGLVACLLFKAGAIDKVGVVQPLASWL